MAFLLITLTVRSFSAVKVSLISVASFEDSNFYQIPKALKDANQFINLLSKVESINQDDILYLENPKLPKLSSTLTKLFSEAQQNDTIFLYFFGHGFAEGGNIYLPMSDSKSDSLKNTSYNFSSDLKRLLEIKKAKEIFVILNTSYSDDILKNSKIPREKVDIDSIRNIISKKKVAILLTSEMLNQSYLLSEGNSQISELLLKAFIESGKQEWITIQDVYEYVRDRLGEEQKKRLVLIGESAIELIKNQKQ